MNHIMIDLETLSTAKNAVILSLGAVVFDPHGITLGNSLHLGVHPSSQQELGGDIDGGTILWHFDKKSEFPSPALSIDSVIRQLTVFYKREECRRVWSNGATFDIPIIEFYFKRLGMSPPWHYGDARDTRTAYEIAGWDESPTRKLNLHDALEDALKQAELIQKAYALIKTSPFGETKKQKEKF